MSSLEKRAWLGLLSMCPPYFVYFMVQASAPDLAHTVLQRFGFLAAIAGFHAIAYIVGLLVIKHGERGDLPFEDERDRTIDARATRAAYYLLLAGIIVVGVVMPFTDSGWQIANTALLAIVLAETLHMLLIVYGYRRQRLAH